jgi:anti-anti-sigma regulatory factor
MRGDGRMDAWVWVAAIDTSTMLRLGILIADHIAGGVTDVRLDCTAVESIDDKGFGLLARYANQMRGLPKRRGQSGTLTLENVLPELATAIAARGLGGLLEVQLAFPTIPHSPESFQ